MGCKPLSRIRRPPSLHLRQLRLAYALIENSGGGVDCAVLATGGHRADLSPVVASHQESDASDCACGPAHSSACDSCPAPYLDPCSLFYSRHVRPIDAGSRHSGKHDQQKPPPPSPYPSYSVSGLSRASCSPSSQSSAVHPHACTTDCGNTPTQDLSNPHSPHHPSPPA